MNLILAALAWIVIGTILGIGIFLLTKGIFWLFISAVIGFVVAVAAIGCKTH